MLGQRDYSCFFTLKSSICTPPRLAGVRTIFKSRLLSPKILFQSGIRDKSVYFLFFIRKKKVPGNRCGCPAKTASLQV
jgi:hypothetical protein